MTTMQARLLITFLTLTFFTTACHSVRRAEVPAGPSVRILTYNVNYGGGPRPDLTADLIRKSGADIVCLQETTPEWEKYLRQTIGTNYTFIEFRHSETRMGGGLAFLSKIPAHEVAYVPSNTGWFDGWIMKFDTSTGPLQVLSVHLRPPVSDSGSLATGYLTTRGDRVHEMERFYARRDTTVPILVAGDFNDGEHSRVIKWLEQQKMANALPQFDRSTPTWEWQTSVVRLHRRMDHILYSPELRCSSAKVLRDGSSDHFPVEAVFTRRQSMP